MLKGEKTFLRPLEPSDIEIFYLWYNDQEVNHWSSAGWPLNTMLTLEEIEERYFTASQETRYMILDEKKKPLGTIGYRELDISARSALLFIVIGEKNYWGKGYGTDALKTLIEFLFYRWNLNRLSLDTWDDNLRAQKTFAKLGFRNEGRLRQARFHNGRYHDAILMGLLKAEYPLENYKA